MISAILEQLANEPKTNSKIAILKQNSNNLLLKTVCYYATNRLLPFKIGRAHV